MVKSNPFENIDFDNMSKKYSIGELIRIPTNDSLINFRKFAIIIDIKNVIRINNNDKSEKAYLVKTIKNKVSKNFYIDNNIFYLFENEFKKYD